MPVSNEAVSVSLLVGYLYLVVGLLARLKSYLVLIRIIRPLSISLTIYHYGVHIHTVLWWVARMGQTRTTHSRDHFIGFHQSRD